MNGCMRGWPQCCCQTCCAQRRGTSCHWPCYTAAWRGGFISPLRPSRLHKWVPLLARISCCAKMHAVLIFSVGNFERKFPGSLLSLGKLSYCFADIGKHLPEKLQSSLATAPSPDPWLLRPEGTQLALLGSEPEMQDASLDMSAGVVTREGSGNVFLDPVSGRLLSSDECLLKHPTLQQVHLCPFIVVAQVILIRLHQHDMLGTQDASWGIKAILRVWADSCRLAMVSSSSPLRLASILGTRACNCCRWHTSGGAMQMLLHTACIRCWPWTARRQSGARRCSRRP